MNIGVHVSLSDLVSSVCMPRNGIAGSYGSYISSFLRIYMEFRKMVMITLYEKQKKRPNVQNSLLDSVGGGEGGMFRKNSMYIIYIETDHQPRLDA